MPFAPARRLLFGIFLGWLGPAFAQAERPSSQPTRPFSASLPATSLPATSKATSLPATSLPASGQTSAPALPRAPEDRRPPPRKQGKNEEIAPIVVTGTRSERRRSDTITPTEVINRKQIEASAALNLGELLQTHPGIQLNFSEAGVTGLQIQGLDSKYLLILVDGQRIAGRIRGVVDLQRFPLDQIERIEIVKGASSALYGADAIGGVINIITRRSKKPLSSNLFGQYGYGGGHLIDATGDFAMRRKVWGFQLAFGFHRYDPYDLKPEDIATSGSSNLIVDASALAFWTPSKMFEMNLRAHYLYQDRAGIEANTVGAVFDRKSRTETITTNLQINALFPSLTRWRTFLNFNLFRDQFLYDQRESSSFDLFQETFDWTAQIVSQVDHPFNEYHLLSIGFEGLYEELRTDRIKNSYASRLRGALYTQYEGIFPAIRTAILPGFRAEFDSQFGFAAIPRLALRLDLHKSFLVRASFGFGYRAPSFKELYLTFENTSVGYVVEGNPALRPEYSRSWQASVEWKPVGWLTLYAGYFRNEMTDLIVEEVVTTPTPTGTFRVQYSNIASAMTQGLEASLRFQPHPVFQMELSYTLTDSRDSGKERPLPFRALHQGSLQFVLKEPFTELVLSGQGSVVGERFVFLDTNGDKIEETIPLAPYVLINLRLSRSFFSDRLTVFLAVQNLLNTGDHQWLPLRPRTFFVGVRSDL